MRHLLILLLLVACGFYSSAQSTIYFDFNGITPTYDSLWWRHGDVEEEVDAKMGHDGRLVVIGAPASLLTGDLLSLNIYTPELDVYTVFLQSTVVAAPGRYTIPVADIMDGENPWGTLTLNSQEAWNSYLTAVPEPSTNAVFFSMGLTLLLLSNRCRSGRWLPFPGLSVQPLSSSRSGGSGAL